MTQGAENYYAPETFHGKTTTKSDIWSAGCILYELLSGVRAFNEGNPQSTHEKIMKGDFKMEEGKWDQISVQAKDLVRKLMKFDSEKRLSADQALEHIWLKTNSELYSKETDISTKSLKECLTNMKLHKVTNTNEEISINVLYRVSKEDSNRPAG